LGGAVKAVLLLLPQDRTFLGEHSTAAMGQYATSPRRAKSNELLHAPIVPL
jgi:hypothetical protein